MTESSRPLTCRNFIRFEVHSPLVGKGRPRFTRTGRPYTPVRTREYEQLVRQEYVRAGGIKFNGLIGIVVEAWRGVPKGASKRAREAMLSGEIVDGKLPDIDNIVKAIQDALNGVAYDDDVQVCRLVAQKGAYAETPYVRVCVYELPLSEIADWSSRQWSVL